MMQTFTKTELCWIYSALKDESMKFARIERDTEEPDIARSLAHHQKENMQSLMHKISCILSNNDKRIAIK